MTHDDSIVRACPRPAWSPLPFEGCVGVAGRVLHADDALVVATLRFEPHATVHEHDAPFDIDVVCLEGAGFVSVGERREPLSAGQTLRWPAHLDHRLWTEEGSMTTLMLERLDTRSPSPA